MNTDILIIGGGLAGLSLARKLQNAGCEFQLIEARGRLGGRIDNCTVTHNGKTGHYDMGPAWFWPGQPRLAKLTQELGVEVFEQYYQGALCYEDERGRVQRGRGFASMQGSYRIEGGISSVIEALVKEVDLNTLHLNHKAIAVTQSGEGLTTSVITSEGTTILIKSEHVVLALPPRVAAESVTFSPELPSAAIESMKSVPTWMAGHAKIVAVYETAFWREAGLSGDASSRFGPMMEIHDASPRQGGPYALFGFVGIPAQNRKGQETALLKAAKDQLVRLFGLKAAKPLTLELRDWAFEPETATELDLEPLSYHPQYGLPTALRKIWEGKLQLGSTETGTQFGGYLEGALEASEKVFATFL